VLDPSDIERVKTKLSKALKGFENGPPDPSYPYRVWTRKPEPKLFPVPELVLFALRDIMGFRSAGVGEKVRWSVYAQVNGEPLTFELYKFGFVIGHRERTSTALLERVEKQLSSSLRFLEPMLSACAKAQIYDGNLTVVNRIAVFDNRYRYFRELADKAFLPAEHDRSPTTDRVEGPILGDMSRRLNEYLGRSEEGYFASGAMVDAYFSRLEHHVLLLRAFVGRSLEEGGFKRFLEMTWNERLREVVGNEPGKKWGRLLGKLREVKATIRNPLAHGGIENDDGAFYFHMPRVGAIPGNLSRHRGRLQTSFFPIAELEHAEICNLFDEIDVFLAEGQLKLPSEFIRAGLDAQFDEKGLARFAAALADGPEAVEALISKLSREWERHANMDY
jgi:hypothetical protein